MIITLYLSAKDYKETDFPNGINLELIRPYGVNETVEIKLQGDGGEKLGHFWLDFDELKKAIQILDNAPKDE